MDLAVSTHDDGTYGLTVDGQPFEPVEGEVWSRDSIAEVVSDVLIWFGPDAHATEPEIETVPSSELESEWSGPDGFSSGPDLPETDEAPVEAPETQE